MKPFKTSREMLDAHEQMFGAVGRQCAEVVLHWADKLFDVPLDALNIRVVLAPVELGPYNRHAGYHFAGEGAFILGNRHIVQFKNGSLEFTERGSDYINSNKFEDFIVHELTHARQHQLLRANPKWKVIRGVHRDLGWYTAVAEACPRFLGVGLPRSIWPTGPRTRSGTLTEVLLTHWPESIRHLIEEEDPRLAACTTVNVQRRTSSKKRELHIS